MFGFGKKRIDKGAWAEAIFGKKLKNPNQVSEQELSTYTTGMLEQYLRIILESVSIVQTTRNSDTRQGRINLCYMNLERMMKLEQFCNTEQKAMILQAEDAMRGIQDGK